MLHEDEISQIIWNYNQLREIVKDHSDEKDSIDSILCPFHRMVYEEIPELLKKSAPANIYELLGDLQAVYEALKDFMVYSSLIRKNIVGLGGGFSSGKSSFLNAMLGAGEVLPENINPSTSVPTYIVNGQKNAVKGINVFHTCMDLDLWSINAISHGFGAVGTEEEGTKSVELGHILRNLILETSYQMYENLAFLDTPGYSKPDEKGYSDKTDAAIARRQLNTVNYILWFLPVSEGGTLPESDVQFLKTLDLNIPVTIICSKAKRRTESQRAEIKTVIQRQVAEQKLSIKDILFFDTEAPQQLDAQKIFGLFSQWNRKTYDGTAFSREFKCFFFQIDRYFDDEIREAGRRLNRLEQALLCMDCSQTILDGMHVLVLETKQEIQNLKQSRRRMEEIEFRLFVELKKLSDLYGFAFQIPTQRELLKEKQGQVVEENKGKRRQFATRETKYASKIKERFDK